MESNVRRPNFRLARDPLGSNQAGGIESICALIGFQPQIHERGTNVMRRSAQNLYPSAIRHRRLLTVPKTAKNDMKGDRATTALR